MINPQDVRVLQNFAGLCPMELMVIPGCRQYVAASRWRARKNLEFAENLSEGVMPGTITHNRQETEQGLFGSAHRTQRLIGPLSALDPVYSNPGKLKVLSIGPRTEMELLHLMGIGFKEENIRGLDLISSSPLIDVGDMHAMPYEDASFDVVISGWVLTYSNDPGKAIKEMVRVCKPGGLIAIGTTYDPNYGKDYVAGTKDDPENIVGCMFSGYRDFYVWLPREFIGCFYDEPPDEQTKGPVMLIVRKL